MWLQLSESEFDKELNSLRLFAYGSYQDYCGEQPLNQTHLIASVTVFPTSANPSNFLDLSDQQLTKLRQLSLLSMAAENRILSYQTMHTALGLATVRELEDLLIDTIYAVSSPPPPAMPVMTSCRGCWRESWIK